MKSPLRKPKPTELIAHQKDHIGSLKFRMERDRPFGVNFNGIQHKICCAEEILRLLKKHYKDPQRDLFENSKKVL